MPTPEAILDRLNAAVRRGRAQNAEFVTAPIDDLACCVNTLRTLLEWTRSGASPKSDERSDRAGAS